MDHFIGQMDATTGDSQSTSSHHHTPNVYLKYHERPPITDTPPPLTLMQTVDDDSDSGPPLCTTTVGIDKHRHWQWSSTSAGTTNQDATTPSTAHLPHLDGDTVADVLQ